MKKFLFCILSTLTLNAMAAEPSLGLGAVLGSPTGLSANVFFSQTRTLHNVLAYDLSGDDEFYLASHYTIRRPNDITFPSFKLGWFYGGGAQFETEEHRRHDHTFFGPSGTAGLYYDVPTIPLEVFLKSNLAIYVIDSTEAQIDVMLGLHYNL